MDELNMWYDLRQLICSELSVLASKKELCNDLDLDRLHKLLSSFKVVNHKIHEEEIENGMVNEEHLDEYSERGRYHYLPRRSYDSYRKGMGRSYDGGHHVVNELHNLLAHTKNDQDRFVIQDAIERLSHGTV